MKITLNFQFAVVLFLVFLILKLTGVIAWSWIWVFSPLWISAIICLIVLAIFMLVVKRIKKHYRW